MSHHLKRLQHEINPNLHLSSHNSHPTSFDHRSQLSNDEVLRESLHQFTISTNNHRSQFPRPFNPGPQRARRGGGRPRDRHGHSSLILPKRAINYDLAESFVDHSTNPLSSDLYQIKFKHSTKQWPDGRFKNYREKQDKLDGNILEITCTRTFPVVAKRKKIPEADQNQANGQTSDTISFLSTLNPVVQEEKKKQVNKQTNIYANLFGGGRIPRLSATTQTKKSNPTGNSTASSSASISLLGEHQPNPPS